MVQRMTTEGRFDYDAVTYAVASARAYYDSYYPRYTAFGFGYGWGSPYRYGLYSACYDPFFYDPFLCYDPFFYSPYRYSFSFGVGDRPYIFYCGGDPVYNPPRPPFLHPPRAGTRVGKCFKD